MMCLVATAFVAWTANAAVDYTGSVVSTDNSGAPKSTYFRGEPIYANVELNERGVPYDGYVTVSLVRVMDGYTASHYHAWTDNPVTGWNNGSASGSSLSTVAWFDGDAVVYDVVATYNSVEIARTSVVVLKVGLWMEPSGTFYYPGQALTIRLVTTHTTDVFYVQIVNDTGATMMNWTGQVALDGRWQTAWTVPSDFPDGSFSLVVRDSASHAIWDSTMFTVQKYGLLILSDRATLLPGETAHISYETIEIATLSPYAGVTVNYSAHWVNKTGNDRWQNATLPGSSGVHTFDVPTNIALYSNVEIVYWANETTGSRSAEQVQWLYVDILKAEIQVSPNQCSPGDVISLSVNALVGFDYLPGAVVNISVSFNGTAVPAYGATGLITGAAGSVNHEFMLAADAPEGTYIATAVVSKVGSSVTRMVSFDVSSDGSLILAADKDSYYSGDTVQLTFDVIWNNQHVVPASTFYIAVGSVGLIATGTSTDGTASFVIPMAEQNYAFVQAIVNYAGRELTNGMAFPVYLGNVAVIAANERYAPSDRITFGYEVVTHLSSADLDYTILDDAGRMVASGALPFAPKGTIAFDVPSDPSSSYTCRVRMSTPDGWAVSASDSSSIYADYGFEIAVGESPYLSGAFKPGDTLDIDYVITLRGVPDLAVYGIVIWNTWSDSPYSLLTSDLEGTVQMVLPSTVANGAAYIQATLYDAISGAILSDSSTAVSISDGAGDWDTTIGDMQNATDQLQDDLAAAQDDINSMSSMLGVLQDQLDSALAALDITLDQLEALQNNMSSLEDGLESVDGEISDRPTAGEIATWFVIAIVVLAIIAVALTMLMRKK